MNYLVDCIDIAKKKNKTLAVVRYGKHTYKIISFYDDVSAAKQRLQKYRGKVLDNKKYIVDKNGWYFV